MGFPMQDLRERRACIGQREPQRSSGHDLHLDFRNRGREGSSGERGGARVLIVGLEKATKVNGEAPGGLWGRPQNSYPRPISPRYTGSATSREMITNTSAAKRLMTKGKKQRQPLNIRG